MTLWTVGFGMCQGLNVRSCFVLPQPYIKGKIVIGSTQESFLFSLALHFLFFSFLACAYLGRRLGVSIFLVLSF